MEQLDFLPVSGFEVPKVKLVYEDKHLYERPVVTSSQVAERIIRPYYADVIFHHEMVYGLLLNNANRVLGAIRLGEGTATCCVLNTTSLYQALILSSASACVLIHNHPSGTLAPGVQDKKMTASIKTVLAALDIKLLDHIILSPIEGMFFSFSDEGVL